MRSLLLAAVGTSRWGAVTTSLTPSTWLARPSRPCRTCLRATASIRDCLVRWRSVSVFWPSCPAGRSASSIATRRRTRRLLSIQIGAREKGNGATTLFSPWRGEGSRYQETLSVWHWRSWSICLPAIDILLSFNTRPLESSALRFASEMTQVVIFLGG